ncbi:hypothetical protein [Pseudomonas fluorescens]|uniref:hypothetical protein n=1 Tax=Pseudomonas fluorescens TaxID=294 RepID=UPI001241A4A0|nr:hypothetical protein [Pseudomonas fluorescens]
MHQGLQQFIDKKASNESVSDKTLSKLEKILIKNTILGAGNNASSFKQRRQTVGIQSRLKTAASFIEIVKKDPRLSDCVKNQLSDKTGQVIKKMDLERQKLTQLLKQERNCQQSMDVVFYKVSLGTAHQRDQINDLKAISDAPKGSTTLSETHQVNHLQHAALAPQVVSTGDLFNRNQTAIDVTGTYEVLAAEATASEIINRGHAPTTSEPSLTPTEPGQNASAEITEDAAPVEAREPTASENAGRSIEKKVRFSDNQIIIPHEPGNHNIHK